MKISSLLSLIAGLLLVTSCSTSSFMGLSKSAFVDSEFQRLGETADEIESINSRMAELDGISAELDGISAEVTALREEVTEVRATEEELQDLAIVLQSRLNSIPEDTLKELVKAIESYYSDEIVENPLLTDDVLSPAGDG
jgi:archaellum component FlaC